MNTKCEHCGGNKVGTTQTVREYLDSDGSLDIWDFYKDDPNQILDAEIRGRTIGEDGAPVQLDIGEGRTLIVMWDEVEDRPDGEGQYRAACIALETYQIFGHSQQDVIPRFKRHYVNRAG